MKYSHLKVIPPELLLSSFRDVIAVIRRIVPASRVRPQYGSHVWMIIVLKSDLDLCLRNKLKDE
jgi:hypothetical protein